MNELTARLLSGDRRALARLLTYVENERGGIQDVMAALFPHTGHALIVGVTGAPGTGKSTLVSALAKHYRARGQTVGILAVDPTSPFTGGAILGDRIRMRDLSGDTGVFVRSMASRGSLGGLAPTVLDAARLMDAAGFDVILIETVGVGQGEVDIARAAQTTLVVETPGMGDDVQAIKAGVLEIADVLVVNKADRPGADQVVRSLRAMLELGHPAARGEFGSHHGRLMKAEAPKSGEPESPLWLPPVVETVAAQDKGIDELIDAIARHHAYWSSNPVGAQVERRQIELELYDRLRAALMDRLLRNVPDSAFMDMIGQIQSRALTPGQAVEQLLAASAQPAAE
jgi:LAO/AO transport system kinase